MKKKGSNIKRCKIQVVGCCDYDAQEIDNFIGQLFINHDDENETSSDFDCFSKEKISIWIDKTVTIAKKHASFVEVFTDQSYNSSFYLEEITSNDVKLSKEKIGAVINIPIPKNINEVPRSIQDLLEKDISFKWGKFNELKGNEVHEINTNVVSCSRNEENSSIDKMQQYQRHSYEEKQAKYIRLVN
ncbi:hypothetical protein FF38_02243 [Lucilia cuprina]|uniref:Uncharacterized protein n=1 Tax=Lucilia cuprina TaxID=7375 RepID=A0A0L0C5F2_LUCCU|nr:hypothetical protein FF38_02243 [Lucilia cuprina]